jgi:hypothetical protein
VRTNINFIEDRWLLLMSPPCSPISTCNLTFRLVVVFSALLLHMKIISYNNSNTHLHLPLNTHQTDDRGKIFVIFCSKQNYIDTHSSAISTQEIGECSMLRLVVVKNRHRINTKYKTKMAAVVGG